MRNYKAKQYIKLVENIEHQGFLRYIADEIEFVQSINNSKSKTFIDLGAGYGRIVPFIYNIIYDYIGIEINNDMFKGLKHKSDEYKNVRAVHGDMILINKLLKRDSYKNPVIMLLQNTLGSIEGELDDVLNSIKSFFQENKGELVLSILKASSLKTFGLSFYNAIEPICGKYNPKKSDLENGIFVSNTGYESKWWKKKEIENIIQFLKADSFLKIEKENYYFYKLTF